MSKYLTLFDTQQNYQTFKDSDSFITPNVTLVTSDMSVHYPDFSQNYLTFVAREQGTFKLTIGSNVSTSLLESISYSVDYGDTWTTTNNIDSQVVTIETPTIQQGKKVMWKGIGTSMSVATNATAAADRSNSSSIFSSTGQFDAEGNIMSLLKGDNFKSNSTLTGTSNFALLFYSYNTTDTAKVILAGSLVLPSTICTDYCYTRMFQGCSNLVNVPKLPATTLANFCYSNMFYGCTSLTEAPKLPAKTLTSGCYYGMFWNCTSLVNAPKLPAITLHNNCYYGMFYNCVSLVNAPELPVTKLENGCYKGMFYNCTSLVTAPELPATTLAIDCYSSMFQNCTSLINAPSILPATTLAESCYRAMFYGCTSLTTSFELSVTTLATSCYESMFQNCTSLTRAPELPAITLEQRCYYDMFNGCTNLTDAPTLSAKILVTQCYLT